MKNIIYHISILLNFSINFILCLEVTPRRNPGCALLGNTIFCYRGLPFISFTAFNDPHVSLDLTQVTTTNNETTIPWQSIIEINNSDTILDVRERYFHASASIQSDQSYVIYGASSGNTFMDYNPHNFTWKQLPTLPGANKTMRSTIVNLGNDTLWIWGGENFPMDSEYIPNIARVFNYKTLEWTNQFTDTTVMRMEHTATLGLDKSIYILGGTMRYPNHTFVYSSFNDVRKFDTISTQWSSLTAGGETPSPRVSHTTTQLPNRNQLFIYGGVNADRNIKVDQETPSSDYCFIYDYKNNTFISIQFPEVNTDIKNTRYGHFATIYNDTYLVMAFGFMDTVHTSPSLSILNISNPYQPNWITSFSTANNNNQANPNITENVQNNLIHYGISNGVIVAIVVPLVIVVLGAIIGCWLFYKKQQKGKNNFSKNLDIKNIRGDYDDDMDPILPLRTQSIETNSNQVKYMTTTGRVKLRETISNQAPYFKLSIKKEVVENVEEKTITQMKYTKLYDDQPYDNSCKPNGDSDYMNYEKLHDYQPIEDYCKPSVNK
ncbi:hypothetical protein BJ944DRAFT_252349 [Cunninghamella echinulata]|nr:hypothetical protein BJ944DRAFT_252349 [Cunninghamella echinulata]